MGHKPLLTSISQYLGTLITSKNFIKLILKPFFLLPKTIPAHFSPRVICSESVNERNWSNLVSHQDFYIFASVFCSISAALINHRKAKCNCLSHGGDFQ